MKRISVSIVSSNNSLSDIIPTLENIVGKTRELKLYIIDNSPTNVLQKELSIFPVEYIHNPSNPGYGAAHNIAIKKSIELSEKYHFVINPDIYFKQGTIENIVEFMDNVWIGESVSVLPGVTIGQGAIIGANSVVSKNIPAYTIAVGSPAKPIKKFNFETTKWENI